MQRVGLGRWGSVSVGSSGLASIRRRALRPLPIAAAHGVGAECDTFMCFCVCGCGTMTRDWQTISRMPAVTDATPDIPFRGKRQLGQRHASSFHGPSGHQRKPPPPTPRSFKQRPWQRWHKLPTDVGSRRKNKQTKQEDGFSLNFLS